MTLPDFLEGAIDMHVHSAPDVDPRRFDDIDLVREACRAGMGGVLLKSHQSSTVERAFLVSRIVSGIAVYGGIVLNETVGGFNPHAVRAALQMGARQVWMPTRAARNHRLHHGLAGGLCVFDQDGCVRREVAEILEMVAGAGCTLGTGHLAPTEVSALIPHAIRVGVQRILVTHPEWSVTYYPVDLQQKLAETGRVFFERCFVSTTELCGSVPFQTIASAIEEVGVSTTILSTDLGQPSTPPPAEGFRIYAERLHSHGFAFDDLRTMMRTNPGRLLAVVGSEVGQS